jgi:HAD superfamily hydrolase (TIGR01509 family)
MKRLREIRSDGKGGANGRPDYDLIIFDCDGVLVDSEVVGCECLRATLCEFGYPIDLEGVVEKFLGRSFSVVREEYQLALGRPLGGDFVDRHRQALREAFAASLRPMPEIEGVLDSLATPFCVASSSDTERLAFSLAITGLAPRFGERVFSADAVARGKPAPDLFLHAARLMGAEPFRSLVIEDSVMGVRAGKAAGMTVWGFTGGTHNAGRDASRLLAEAGADRITATLADVRGF